MSNTTTAVAGIELNVFNDFAVADTFQCEEGTIFRVTQLLVEAVIDIIGIA